MRTKLEEAAYQYREARNELKRDYDARAEKIKSALTLLSDVGITPDNNGGASNISQKLYEIERYTWSAKIEEAHAKLIEAAMKEQD